jgi:parallel beta-helix repeat protein
VLKTTAKQIAILEEGTHPMNHATKLSALIFISAIVMCAASISFTKAETTHYYIKADGTVEPPNLPIQVNRNVYTLTGDINNDFGIIIQKANIILDGAGYTIRGTNLTGGAGIMIISTDTITVQNLKLNSFDYGIYLQNTSKNTIEANTVTNCNYGFYSAGSENNNLNGNTVTNNFRGFHIEKGSNDSEISQNTIENNNFGISIYSASTQNTVNGNNIANNGVGISFTGASGNKIIQNNFINNTGHQAVMDGSVNSWDNGAAGGGNYWSDYSGSGNSPYTIYSNVKDNYPLVNKVVLPELTTLIALLLFVAVTSLVLALKKENRI